MFHQGRQHTICFAKTFERSKKELLGVPVSKTSAIIPKEWKKVKTSDKKMKKYRILYEEEKRQNEEDLQRYQEDHMDEMEIINHYKRCSKNVRRTPQFKKAPNSDESSKEEQRLKKKTQPQKAPKTPGFVDTGLHNSGTKEEQGSKKAATKVGKKS